jgi:hypothetical protein
MATIRTSGGDPVGRQALYDAEGNVVDVVGGHSGALTDRSGTITAGGTAQAAVSANTSRNYLFVRNPIDATEALWVSLVGTAAAASPSVRLDAGDSFEYAGSFIPTNALSVFAATTGHAFTIWEG